MNWAGLRPEDAEPESRSSLKLFPLSVCLPLLVTSDITAVSSDRPPDGAVLQLHQEAGSEPPPCKRRNREEEEVMKRRRRKRTAEGCGENRDPGEDLQRNAGTQNLKREHRT